MEIATRLVISQHTGETPVEHLLAKFGFTNRSEIVAWMAVQPPTM